MKKLISERSECSFIIHAELDDGFSACFDYSYVPTDEELERRLIEIRDQHNIENTQ